MEYNLDMDKDGKCTREGYDQRMRVEFINHPELKTLDRRSVEILECEYKDYKIQLQAQSGTAKPVPRALCVSLELRKVISLESGIDFNNLTQEKILAHLEMVKIEGFSAVQVDANMIFRGIKMSAPKNEADIDRVISDFFVKMSEKMEESGSRSMLLDDQKLSVRKQAFPSLIDGLWPHNIKVMFKKQWFNEDRKWSVGKMCAMIKVAVRTHGKVALYQPDRGVTRSTPYDRKNLNDTTKGRFQQKEKSFVKPSKPFQKRPFQTGDKRNDYKKPEWKNESAFKKKGETKCFKCGIPGHTKPECRFGDTHPKVIEHAKKYKELKRGMRALGVDYRADTQVKVDDFGEKEKEQADDNEVEFESVVDSEEEQEKYSDFEDSQ